LLTFLGIDRGQGEQKGGVYFAKQVWGLVANLTLFYHYASLAFEQGVMGFTMILNLCESLMPG
jgi:hypothetical protein